MTIHRLARLWLLLFVPLLACTAPAQNHYTTSYSGFTVTDATTGCTVGQTRSCWINLSTTPTLTKIYSAGDRSFGLDAGGTIWTLPLNSHTWQSTAYSPMAELSVLPGNNLYGLQLDSAFCGAPEMRIFQYTSGATDFVKLGYCALHIGAASDGTLYRIRSSGNVSHLVSGTWISDPSAGGNGTPVKIVAGSASNVWLITSTKVIKVLDFANTHNFVVTGGLATDITTSGDPLAGNVETMVVGASIVSGNVFRYSSKVNASNGTWQAFQGVALNSISEGSPLTLIGLSTSLHAVYHFQGLRITLNGYTTGYYDCSALPNGQCPQGSYHTATITAHWLAGGNSASGSFGGSPATMLTAYANPWTDDCDPIMGVFGDMSPAPECAVSMQGGVQCAMMGSVFAQGGSPFFGVAETLVEVTGPMFGCHPGAFGGQECSWPVVSNCDQATSPPTFNPHQIDDGPPAIGAWWALGICIRTGYFAPYTCYGAPTGSLKTPQKTPGHCFNP